MAGVDYYTVKDGETLRTVDDGLEIIRRQKHEWLNTLGKMSPEKLAQRTDKIYGSKFYAHWTLPILVSWIEEVIAVEGWTLQPGVGATADRLLDLPVGLFRGQRTRKIRVVSDGRYVHAYPVNE